MKKFDDGKIEIHLTRTLKTGNRTIKTYSVYEVLNGEKRLVGKTDADNYQHAYIDYKSGELKP